MTLPYSNATAGEKALHETQKILKDLGCSKVGNWSDFETGEVTIQFEHAGQAYQVVANAKGYAAAWLRENPWNNRRKGSRQKHEERALEIGNVAIYSILRDWIKGQTTAIQVGALTFESAFLSHALLPDGRRVIEVAEEKKLLSGPGK